MNRSEPARIVQFDSFELDLGTAELRKNGERVRLQEQSFQILSMLLEHPGSVVSRDEIQRKLWSNNTVVEFENSMNAAVMRLRQALGDSAETPRYVETVPRRGYRFIALVESPDRSLGDASEGAVPSSPPRRFNRLRLLALAAFVIVPVVLWLVTKPANRRMSRGSSEADRVVSVAVLPFENLSRDPDQEYFADGVTDELIATLAQIRALRVISRTSVMQYKKGPRKPLRLIADELKVDAVLEGTVLQSGNRVRITAQLIEVRSDTHLWAETFERDVRDVLTIQNEVARLVAHAVRAKLSPAESARLVRRRDVDPRAQEAYLRGRYYASSLTNQSCEQGIVYFNQAIALDPNYADAYAGLSGCYATLTIFGPLPAAEAFPKAKAAALKAISLDEGLGLGHACLASVLHLYEWNWKDAGVEFERSLELSPGTADAHMWYAAYLITMRRSDEALVHLRTGKALDPISQSTNLGIAFLLTTARKYDYATQNLRELLNIYPDFMGAHYELARSLSHKGLHKEAGAESLRAQELSDDTEDEKNAFRRSHDAFGAEGVLRTQLNSGERASKLYRVKETGLAALSALLGEGLRVRTPVTRVSRA